MTNIRYGLGLYKYGSQFIQIWINQPLQLPLHIDEAKAKMRPWRQKGFIREEKANHVQMMEVRGTLVIVRLSSYLTSYPASSCFFHHMSHSRARRQCQLLVGSRGGTVSTGQCEQCEHQDARRSRPRAVFTSWARWEVPIQGSFPGSSEPTMAKVFFLRACQ